MAEEFDDPVVYFLNNCEPEKPEVEAKIIQHCTLSNNMGRRLLYICKSCPENHVGTCEGIAVFTKDGDIAEYFIALDDIENEGEQLDTMNVPIMRIKWRDN